MENTKTFATEIESVARTNDYQGNLYNKIMLHYPDSITNLEDRRWVSYFQTENLNCLS